MLHSIRRGHRSWAFALVGASLLALVLGAHGTLAPTRATPAENPNEPKAAWKVEWDNLVAAAQREGKVRVVFGGAATRNWFPVLAHFEKKLGIQALGSGGSGREQVERLLAETRARRWEVDIAMLGASGRRLANAGVLAEIKEMLVLPDVLDQSLWYGGQHRYDPLVKGNTMFAYAGSLEPPHMGLILNTNLANPAEFKSTWDFLNPKWKGKMAGRPPNPYGSANESWATGVLHPELGEEWVKRLVTEMDMFFTDDIRTMMDGVATGRFAVVIFSGGARVARRLRGAGAPIAVFADLDLPWKEAPTLKSSGATQIVMALRTQPNPNAARVFLNWFLSREGQEAAMRLAEDVPTPSLRDDLTTWGKAPVNQIREIGREYPYLTHSQAWIAGRPAADAFLTKMLKLSRKRKR